MKANELMIDDWVYRHDCYDQVKEISNNGIIGLDSLRGRIMFGELKPIPLTEEILVKNGFVQSGSKFTWGEISVIFTIKGFSFWTKHMINIAADNGSRINNLHRYVHELQHALRLCGIKKEIEL